MSKTKKEIRKQKQNLPKLVLPFLKVCKCQLLNTKHVTHIASHKIMFVKGKKANLHKIFLNLHNSHSIFNLLYTHRLPSWNHSKQTTLIILLWYSRSSGTFCRVQSNALIWALFQCNILTDALLKVRQDMEGHWSALGMRNHFKQRKDPETWSRFLSPYFTKLSLGCQLAYFFSLQLHHELSRDQRC